MTALATARRRTPRTSTSTVRCHDALTRADVLRKANARLPMSQREVALLCGVSRSTVFNLEQAAITKISRALAGGVATCLEPEPRP